MASLTQDEAAARAHLLRVRSYHVDLDVSDAATSDTFTSTTTAHFTCAAPGQDTFIEIKPATLHEVVLNGVALDPASLDGNRFPLTELAADNTLIVRATMLYSRTGEGLHRFVDPADGEVYLAAQSGLDEAQRIFACFDQPDLKASLAVTVDAPAGWLVAANGAGRQLDGGRWEFTPTRPLPTYLACVIAGPYHVRTDKHDGIPLGLYCRRSLAEDLDKDAEELFDITRRCLDRFHELFGIRYPFGKYDQAFVPEFNWGAMENAGLVAFRDEYVFRAAVTDFERQTRAMIIAHEMAHMWFGDLVTMRWWDDLWLNESFAEYLGYRVAAEATQYTGAWVSFALGRKAWGYRADQRLSTHPIAPERVADTEHALMNFDGISYAKGASVLRQLVAWLGDDAFFAGLREHFQAHAYGNATLADLLAALSASSGRDLTGWARVWLREAQVNTLRPVVELGPDGRYASVEVEQTAPDSHPVLRPHRIGVGVYAMAVDADDPDAVHSSCAVVLRERHEIDLDPQTDGGRTPVPALTGVAPGDLLLLNDGDLTFAKVRFDAASTAALPRVLPCLVDPLARALAWGAAMDLVRDASLRPGEFVTLAAAGLRAESDVTIYRDVVAFAVGDVARRYVSPSARPAALAALAAACRGALGEAAPGSGLQLAAARGLVAAAGPGDVRLLRDWLSGAATPEGLAMDAELRWLVLGRLAALGDLSAAEIDAEYDRDRSAQGAEHAAACRAARPDPVAKAAAWEIIVADRELSQRLLLATATGFWQADQEELTAPYVARYFAEMPEVATWRTTNVMQELGLTAFPRYAVDEPTLAAARAMLARPDLDPTLRRAAADETDDLARAVAARRLT
ncbi:aminopeptidase N [Luedemannella helvata]|uniref:Aminopeptidase N n=1 Tax=Luedemannella helvata TaxID=349315 RepID=A0ABP4WLF7_9ACTN